MSALRLLCALIVCGVAAESWEDIVNHATARVHDEIDPDFRVIDVMSCHHNPERWQRSCWTMDPMSRFEDARYMRVVYCMKWGSSPNVEVTVNLTTVPASMDLVVHQEDWMEDQDTLDIFPPPTLDFRGATALVTHAVHAGMPLYQMSWRRPLHPCVSEDLFQFVLGDDQLVVSVGSESHRVCLGQVTQSSRLPMCGEPRCIDNTDATVWASALRNSTNAIVV